MKVGIFTADSNGGYPVPASKGGAVSTLIENLVKCNNEQKLIAMEINSLYDTEAELLAKKYPNIDFAWIKPPSLLKALDYLTFIFVKCFFKNKKALSYRSIWTLVYYIFFASRKINNSGYDKVVLENNIPLAWIIKLAKYKGEYYYHFHNVPRINAGVKDVFEHCNGFLCVSNFVGEQIKSAESPIGPVPTEKVKTLYNCIDTDLFAFNYDKRKDIRERYGITSGEKLVLFVGRLSEEKGIDKLLEAMQLVKSDCKVLIVGSYLHGSNIKDEYQYKLKLLADELGDRVIFTGFIPQKDISNVYNAADVAVLPSMWDEPAGLTMIEAMACGIPVITTESGGIPEYAGGNSIILKRDENLPANIAKAIDGILSKTINYDIKNAEQCIRNNYNAKKYLRSFVESL